MPRIARQHSATDVYHVTVRGAGRRSFFEDDDDRIRFVRKLKSTCEDNRIALLAWCLMDNHYHLLAKGKIEKVSRAMMQLNTSLANWYNGRYGHVGPVVQGRFSSTPVEGESHLLEAVRYIHLNPYDKEEIEFKNYLWSSYRQYIGEPGICETGLVLGIFGGVREFEAFHEDSGKAFCLPEDRLRKARISDSEARAIASEVHGPDFGDRLARMEKAERNMALRYLHDRGASIRQLERLTGIGRGIVQPAIRHP